MTTYVSSLEINSSRAKAILSALEFYKQQKNIQGFEPALRFKSEVLEPQAESLEKLGTVKIRVNDSLCGILIPAISGYLSHTQQYGNHQSLANLNSLRHVYDELRANMELSSFLYPPPNS